MWTYWLNQQTKLALAHVDWMLGAPKLKRRFLKRHGYRPNLENPQTFSEKIQWRKLYDKNPICPVLSNKYLVRQYIADRLGQDRAQELLVPLLQYTKDPDSFDFERLPTQFVLKASHGSGMNLIVEDASKLDHAATHKLMRKWLMTHYRVRDHEWNYTKTPRGILAEKLIAKADDLIDVKMFFFAGRMRVFLVGEFKNGMDFLTFFNADLEVLNVRSPGQSTNPNVTLPEFLEDMVEIGEDLSRDLDFVRVDFLCTKDRFYIGELTCHPNSGLVAMDPPSYHQMVGRFWTLPAPITKTNPSNR